MARVKWGGPSRYPPRFLERTGGEPRRYAPIPVETSEIRRGEGYVMLCPLKVNTIFYVQNTRTTIHRRPYKSKRGQEDTIYISTRKHRYGHKNNNFTICNDLCTKCLGVRIRVERSVQTILIAHLQNCVRASKSRVKSWGRGNGCDRGDMEEGAEGMRERIERGGGSSS